MALPFFLIRFLGALFLPIRSQLGRILLSIQGQAEDLFYFFGVLAVLCVKRSKSVIYQVRVTTLCHAKQRVP